LLDDLEADQFLGLHDGIDAVLVSEGPEFLKLMCEALVLRVGLRAILYSENDMQDLLIIGFGLCKGLPEGKSKLTFLPSLEGLQTNSKVLFQESY
jgi:hypothetical protein